MILFLTSSPSGPLDKPNYDKLLDFSNGFVDRLKTYWKPHMKGLLIAAYPDTFESNDEHLHSSNVTINYNYFYNRILKNEITIDGQQLKLNIGEEFEIE